MERLGSWRFDLMSPDLDTLVTVNAEPQLLTGVFLFLSYAVAFVAVFMPALIVSSKLLIRLPMHSRPSAIVIISALFAYGVFWVYVVSRPLGDLVRGVWLIVSVFGFFALFFPAFRKRFWVFDGATSTAFLVFFLTGLLYLCYFSLIPFPYSPLGEARTHFIWHDPPDNEIPYAFARMLLLDHAGFPHNFSMLPGWRSSDRPPLQTGFFLMTVPGLLFEWEIYYQALSTLLQSTWVIALFHLTRVVDFLKPAFNRVFLICLFNGWFYYNSVYVWPKLLCGALALLGVALMVDSALGGWEGWIAGCVAFALALLAHGGAFFFLPFFAALALWKLKTQPKRLRVFLTGAAVFLAAIIPWVFYQNCIDPPGNKLLKIHLSRIDNDFLGLWEAIKAAYSALTLNEWWHHKWSTFQQIFEGASPFSLTPPYLRVWAGDNRIFSSLGILNWSALISVLLLLRRRTVDGVPFWWFLGMVVNLAFWAFLKFGPRAAALHESSYASQILLYFLLAGLTAHLSARVWWIVHSLNLYNFVAWTIVQPPSNRLIDAPRVNPFVGICLLVSAAAMAYGLRQFRRSTLTAK